ncbi:uncharacterized protein RHIMIDRAFT_276467 [Rhizopus microsporus ATCC 52813]|uniref:LIM zinc-binding domain-containing protein n=1 Tax=Rhizopus microsporus ATCC 52813 TaxID=1340429 RepID=A0A2G4T1H5_RHIZD|nr:uncharacterized protein RHIMIDRAFT_276467 [Rhizopus microsporus ATCC 52813]PHZ14851.1 hypothetical protein RHIMIDRAFT_276467 [Rhizopus microsporus ATCC 52813]
MPFCRCGELSHNEKCKKCGFETTLTDVSKSGIVDRWQSRYLNSVVGRRNLVSPVQEQADENQPRFLSAISNKSATFKERPLSTLLDHRRAKLQELKSKDLFRLSQIQIEQPIKDEKVCQECNQKLSGKLVRLPDTQERYHWNCLRCEGCKGLFDNTSFVIDPLKKIYHPKCALFMPSSLDCSECSLPIIESYIVVNSSTLHVKCFKCTCCNKVLQPSVMYTDMNGAFCQQCTATELPQDQELLSKHMRIVPFPQSIPATRPAIPKGTLLYEDNEEFSGSGPEYKTVEHYLRMPASAPCSPYSRHITSFVKPSSLMSSREKPLPRFGIVRACPRCNERITSVHEEIPGPKASRWHKKCLSCTGCNKLLDSGAAVHEDSSTGRLYPWCTTCSVCKVHSSQ